MCLWQIGVYLQSALKLADTLVQQCFVKHRTLQRLLQTFPSVEAYLGQMKRAPVFQPWSETIENYFRYDLEQTNEGVRSKIRFEHISEEMANKRQIFKNSWLIGD